MSYRLMNNAGHPLTTLLYEGLLSRRKSQVFSLFIELTCLVCTNASDNRSLCGPSKTMSIGLPSKHKKMKHKSDVDRFTW